MNKVIMILALICISLSVLAQKGYSITEEKDGMYTFTESDTSGQRVSVHTDINLSKEDVAERLQGKAEQASANISEIMQSVYSLEEEMKYLNGHLETVTGVSFVEYMTSLMSGRIEGNWELETGIKELGSGTVSISGTDLSFAKRSGEVKYPSPRELVIVIDKNIIQLYRVDSERYEGYDALKRKAVLSKVNLIEAVDVSSQDGGKKRKRKK